MSATYWYRVRAYNGVGDSPYGPSVSVSLMPPAAPSSLTATYARLAQIDLAWVKTSGDVTGFKVERAPNDGGSPGAWVQIAYVSAYNTYYTDAGLELNKTYWYRVRAENALGDSLYSNEASATTQGGQFVRVMQWNIEHTLGRQANNYNYAAQAAARIVNFNQPDVLLFNEIDAQNLSAAENKAALIDWVTNNVPHLGNQPDVTFYVAVSSQTDGFNRNAAISRYPIVSPTTHNDGLRGLHSFRVQVSATNAMQVFHTHLKCCADDCTRKQTEAQFDTNVIGSFAATNSFPYIFAGDWNEDEEHQPPVCAITGTYHPITTIRQGAMLGDFRPVTLSGDYRTWSSQQTTPSIRFDYILAATNRLEPLSGFVFSSMDWAARGLYNGNYYDSYYASDHYCVFANYFFPDSHLSVTSTSVLSPAPIPLTINLVSNTTLKLTWSSTAFHLQSAPSASGIYTNIIGATNPYFTPITGIQRFFRLQSN
jgi:endonuclease/exonuclease/phosphatase family metal-dependent hydrolase